MTDKPAYEIPDDAVRVEFWRKKTDSFLLVDKTVFLWMYSEVRHGWVRAPGINPGIVRATATRCATEEEAVTGKKADAWFSIIEALPEENEWVLTFLDTIDFCCVAMYMGQGYAWQQHGRPCSTPSHWQPLPDPPKPAEPLSNPEQFDESVGTATPDGIGVVPMKCVDHNAAPLIWLKGPTKPLTACKDCEWYWPNEACLEGHDPVREFDPHDATWSLQPNQGRHESKRYHSPLTSGYNTDGHCEHIKRKG